MSFLCVCVSVVLLQDYHVQYSRLVSTVPLPSVVGCENAALSLDCSLVEKCFS